MTRGTCFSGIDALIGIARFELGLMGRTGKLCDRHRGGRFMGTLCLGALCLVVLIYKLFSIRVHHVLASAFGSVSDDENAHARLLEHH